MDEKQTNVDNQNVFEEDTLSEDQIIKEGLKFDTKKDLKYVLMGLLIFLMIFVPPVFRVVFYDPTKDMVEVDIVYLTLNCKKLIYRGERRVFRTSIVSNYKDGKIQSSIIEYTWEGLKDDEVIPEAEVLLAVNAKGFSNEKIENGYRFNLDYSDESLFQVPELADYKHAAPAQLNVYKDKGFSCESDTVTERVEMSRDELNKKNK